jgi:HD-GYP domain-containing protein (c-di-GMP phosphodiesterase class II)
LVRQIEEKDLTTAAHTWRVVLYARAMAERAGLGHGLIDRITHAAAMHDVGKLDVPGEILGKPGRLTPGEFEVIKRHTVTGHARLLAMGETDGLALELVRHHHERMDGSGYPDGLKGEEIGEAARHFAVIDTFDALTSVRPYRSEVGPGAAARALEELRAHRHDWYCGEAVDVMCRLYDEGHLTWIMEYFNDRCELPPWSRLPERGG